MGISPQTWSAYESGSAYPSLDVLSRICEQFRVSMDWLLTGQGTPRPPQRIPILARCPAGPPQSWFQEEHVADAPDVFDDFNQDAGPLYALRVVGDSMNPWMWNGDTAVISPTDASSIKSGDVVCARVEGTTEEYTIKRIRFRTGHVALVPDNPNFATSEYPRARVHIQGRVLHVIHKLEGTQRYDPDLLEFLQRPNLRTVVRTMLTMPDTIWTAFRTAIDSAGPPPKQPGLPTFLYLRNVLLQALILIERQFDLSSH